MDREQGAQVVADAMRSASSDVWNEYLESEVWPIPSNNLKAAKVEISRRVFDAVAAALRAEHQAEGARLRALILDMREYVGPARASGGGTHYVCMSCGVYSDSDAPDRVEHRAACLWLRAERELGLQPAAPRPGEGE